jgi:hypothetical protein
MKILLLTILGILFWTDFSFAQDTTYLDPKIEYFSKEGDSSSNLQKLKVYSRYSREAIRVSKDSFKIENIVIILTIKDSRIVTSNISE